MRLTKKKKPGAPLIEPFYQNEVIAPVYCENNYIIKKTNAKSNRAIIFFSGNGIYFPNTSDRFIESIIKNNRYDYTNIAKSNEIQNYYSLIIFIRDINKCWYAKGINNKIDTIDKTVEKLKELTSGYEVTTCGNSSGGYMALYTGLKLKADRIFDFSGQFKLEDSDYQKVMNLYGFQAPNLADYLDEKPDNLFYFCPYNCEQDKEQYELVKNHNLKIFKFAQVGHGITLEGYCYPYILSMSNEELTKICEKYKDVVINAQEFSKLIVPKYKVFFKNLRKSIFSKYKTDDKTYKIITILGITLKFKLRKK